MLRYYITDRRGCENVLDCILRAISDGVEFIQIREKDLPVRELLDLTRAAVAIAGQTRILVNTRLDIALASGAHGVHLSSDSPPPKEWRRIVPAGFLIAQSCHSESELQRAEGADFVVYGPVFDTPGKGVAKGLDALIRAVSVTKTPVFALGGITWENAQLCVDSGAVGIAGIRLFQQGERNRISD